MTRPPQDHRPSPSLKKGGVPKCDALNISIIGKMILFVLGGRTKPPNSRRSEFGGELEMLDGAMS